MKSLHIAALALAATACLSSAPAQQPDAAAGKIKAYVQFDKGRPMDIVLESAQGRNRFIYVDKKTEQQMAADASACKLFFIQTPADLAAAERSYADQELTTARKQLAACKAKYQSYVGLPGNPSTRAALLELECAIRQMDWEGLKALVAAFPAAGNLELDDKALYDTARVLSQVSDDPATSEARLAAVEELRKNKALNSRAYGWLMYAAGRALASRIPADQLQGSLSGKAEADANMAIDALCQAAVSSHGNQMEVPVDAMRRALGLLWAMPGVKEYASKGGAMDAAKWSAAPANFKDAAALAHMMKTVFAPEEKDAFVDRLASFYFNAMEGKEKASK